MRDVRMIRQTAAGGAFLLLVAIALSSSGAYAQRPDSKTGAPAHDSERELGVMLVVTDTAQAFMREWSRTPEAHAPGVKLVSHFRRGAIVTALVFLEGCGADGGSCDAVVDFKVLRPDGSVFRELPPKVAYAGPAPERDVVLLSRAHLAIRIGPKDPFGTYQVIAVLRERAMGRVIRVKKEFEVMR